MTLDPRTPRLLLLLLILALVGREGLLLARAGTQYQQAKLVPYERHFQPGLISAVRWLEDQNVTLIHGLTEPHDPYLNQRLPELMYPVLYRIVPADSLQPGDWVVSSGLDVLNQHCDSVTVFEGIGVGHVAPTVTSP